MKKTNLERFEAVGYTVNHNGCWLWNGRIDKCGYGRCSYYNTTTNKYTMPTASRVSYMIFKGPVADNLLVRHTCDNPLCVNPDHLLTGTHLDNSADMVSRNRHRGGKMPGEINPRSILTEADVVWLRQQKYYHGFYKQMALKFNVNIETIRAAIKGRSWDYLNM